MGQGFLGFGLSTHKLNTPMKIMYLLAYNLLCFMVYHFTYSHCFLKIFKCWMKIINFLWNLNHCIMQKHLTSTFEKQ